MSSPVHLYISLMLWKRRETGWAWFSLGQLAQQPGRNRTLNASEYWPKENQAQPEAYTQAPAMPTQPLLNCLHFLQQ